VKERLTGAIILVVLIVLLVPELLSGPKRRSAPVPAGPAPNSSEEPPLRSYTINLADDSHSRSASAESSGPAMPQPSGPEQPTVQPGAATSDVSKTQSETVGPGSSAPNSQAPKSQSSSASQASSAPQGSSSQPARTGEATARPGEAAVPAQSTAKPSALAQKPAPAAASRSEAPKPAHAAATLEKPTQAHPAAATSTSESGWAVQLGVFASRENAERLALEVRVKGFKASVSPVTSGSRKLYRVRVGPTADRAAAQELQGRLKAVGRPGGTVVPFS
jgi:DedD protein